SLFGYDAEGRAALESLGLSVRPAYKGSSGWRFETASADYGKLLEIATRLEDSLDVATHFTARLVRTEGDGFKSRSQLPFTPASAVRPGMVMADEHGTLDLVTSVERIELEGPVYDLDVERTHNFVANGLVTHNSIYAFRGADIRNILEFER